MKDKIISKATEMFLKLGFKSVTMDDIAAEMGMSKKTIYKYFCQKETLINETTEAFHHDFVTGIQNILDQNFNAIQENFEIRKMFKEMHQSTDTSPAFQLKKHYPEIYSKVATRTTNHCKSMFETNIEKGIKEGLYRAELTSSSYVYFYYTLIFEINENTSSEKEVKKLELDALEYHIRALATAKGITELEKQLANPKYLINEK
jgi:AcrR family transcriptional regulator